MVVEMDPDTKDVDPMELMPIGVYIAADSGQSVSETGALRLPSDRLGPVITNVGDNAGERGPPAEPKELSPPTPLRRLRAKTTVIARGTSGGGSRSLTPPRGAPEMGQRSLWG